MDHEEREFYGVGLLITHYSLQGYRDTSRDTNFGWRAGELSIEKCSEKEMVSRTARTFIVRGGNVRVLEQAALVSLFYGELAGGWNQRELVRLEKVVMLILRNGEKCLARNQ